jgi:hypothetical protein
VSDGILIARNDRLQHSGIAEVVGWEKNTIASQVKGETLIQPVYIGTSDVESAENFAFDVRQCASTLG